MNKHRSNSEKTRDKLLSVAESLFAAQGFESTGVAEICRSAGVSKGAFYHHFESKQEVFFALLDNWMNSVDTQLELIDADPHKIEEVFINLAGLLGTLISTTGDQLPIYFEYWIQAIRDLNVRLSTLEPYEKYRKHITSMLANAITEGTLNYPDADQAGRILIAFSLGVIIQGFFAPDDTDWAKLSQDGVRLFLKGMKDQ